MTKQEARECTLKHLWSSLPSFITELIEVSCMNGEFEVSLECEMLSKENIEALRTLGYNLNYNNSIEDPLFKISWR